jgi:hypothetical protein
MYCDSRVVVSEFSTYFLYEEDGPIMPMEMNWEIFPSWNVQLTHADAF